MLPSQGCVWFGRHSRPSIMSCGLRMLDCCVCLPRPAVPAALRPSASPRPAPPRADTPSNPKWKEGRGTVMGLKLSETRCFILEAAKRAALTPGAGAHDPKDTHTKPKLRTQKFYSAARPDVHHATLRAMANVVGPNERALSQFGTSGVGVTRTGKNGHFGNKFSSTKRF